MKTLLLALGFVGLQMTLQAQTNPVAQILPFTFSSQTGSALPAGIAVHRFGTVSANIPTTRTLIPGNGDLLYVTSVASGGWTGEGANGIGILASGSQAAGALIVAINTTGNANVTVNWTVRTISTVSTKENNIALQYRVGTTGNFTDVGNSSTYVSTGTAVGDFQSYTEVLPAAAENQPLVQVRWVYWETPGGSGARNRLAVDDITIAQGCTPPTNQPTALNFTPTFTSISGSFTPSAAGAQNPDSYLVLRSTSAILTQQPASGTAYAVDDVLGNATVVSINGTTSFNSSNLTPATAYYYFVYAYSTALTCYNINNPLTATVSTNTPPACTPPTTQATALSATAITGSSMTLNYTRGNGDNILIVSRPNSAVNQNPINAVNYPAGSQVGTGNTVIYNGSASSFNYTGLTQNTNYYFALYEYTSATNCYNMTPLTGNFSTSCTTPVDVSALNATGGNTTASITWTNPTASCFDEILVIASTSSITNAGNTFTGPGNPVYTGPNQVVFRGIGSTVNITGLTNGTLYYFKVFTRNAGVYSTGVQTTATPFDPAAGFTYLYGNLHSHSSYSDGNKDNTSKKPIDDYTFARDANCLDFLGISEHNHSGAGMHVANFPLGYADANTINGVPGPTGNALVTLWGMEWGVISGGGHVLVYGFNDQLIGWEAANYNIFCQKGDYATLFNLVNAQPNAFATLAHPQSGDYSNIAGSAYNSVLDNAIYGVAIESGPAFSTNTSYSDFPSSLGFLGYYKTMLAKGYHLGAQMDGDNHYMTFGRQSTNRMVVLSASKTRADVISAIRSMRFYASNDCNVKVDYKCFSTVMGGNLVHAGAPNITLTVNDPDVGETVANIDLYGGLVGSGVTATVVKNFTGGATTVTYTDPTGVQPDGSTWYYFAIITQGDGNKIVTSPIWYSRNDAALPITLTGFNASYSHPLNTTNLTWSTAQENNSKLFVIQRSINGGQTFSDLGSVNAGGFTSTTTNYQYTDLAPVQGTNLYRLKEVDLDGRYQYSRVVSIVTGGKGMSYYSIYPSPAQAFTYVNSTNNISSAITVELIDETGRILSRQNFVVDNSHPAKLDLSQVRKGLYFVKISQEGISATERLVVN